MRLIPHSYNGFLFQQATRVASDFELPYDWNIEGISTNTIPRTQNFPLRSSKVYSGSVKVINVNMTDVNADKDSLIIAMGILDEEQKQLIAKDEFGREWYVNADFVGLNEQSTSDNTASFGVIFNVDDPIWKKYEPSETTILVNGTGSGTITPLGNQPALPVITITPTGAGGFGFSYKRFIQVINNAPNQLTNYPLNLTGAGLDTAALVGAGKMLASGEDLRIFVDGVEVKRWFGGGGINSTTTKIWINWNQPANTNMTLGTAILITGDVATIQIENTAANVALMPTIPTSGNVKINNEIFVYTGVDVLNLQLTGCTRAERQTSAGAHSIADVVYFVTHDVWMYYGWAAIPAYVADDTYKPIISLDSLNTSHVYGDFSLRYNGVWAPGRWVVGTLTNVKSYRVTETPAWDTNAGLFSVLGSYANIPGVGISDILRTFAWTLYNPCGITTITATGKKYRSAAGYATVTMEKSLDGITYSVVWTEAAPTNLATWDALSSHSAVALGATYPYLKLNMIGQNAISLDAHEFGDVTLAIDSTKVPSITIASEATVFTLSTVFSNAANSYTMEVVLSMALNVALTIDAKNKTITLADGSNQINALQNMPIRAEWFPLLPGQDNVITITDAGQVTYDFDYEDRAL